MPMYTVIDEGNLIPETLSAIRSHGKTYTANSAEEVVLVWVNYMLDEGGWDRFEQEDGRLIVLEEGKDEPFIFPWTYEPPDDEGDIHVGQKDVFEVEEKP